MYNLAKKYLLLGLSVTLLIVATLFFFEQKTTTTTPIEVATKKPTKLLPINYDGHIILDDADTVTAGTVDLAAMAQSITTEALKAFLDSDEHSLPLLSHWNVGIPELTDAMNPMYMIGRIEQGEHILVSWKLDPYYADTIGSSYYEESIKKAAELQLPLVFILPSPESALTKDSYYKGLPIEDNPNVVDANNNILDKLSPFGPDDKWKEVGSHWSNTALMDNLQTWYPNPPLVIFISEDEAEKLSWNELASSSRFSQQYPIDKDDHFKRILVGAKWIEKYRQLQNGFKEGFTETAWKNNAKFINYNKFSGNFGKSADWIENATVTNQYTDVWPLTADGVTVDFDLTDSKNDTTANAPHVLANNFNFMLKEAKRVNSNFAYQLSINDDSKITDPTRYRGLTQFSLWFLRPNIIRQKSSAITRAELEPMFKEVADSVELIHYNSQIAEFWKNGKIVSNGDSYLNLNIPEQYKDDPRWFLLDADVNPPKPWSDSMNINVWTFAIVKGEAPNREWLIYTQSPEANLNNVTIAIPGYEDVLVDSNQDGNFYILSENMNQANIVQTNIVPTINTESQNIIVGAREVNSTDISLATKFASPTGTGDGTIDNPYSILDAFNSLEAGDVLFLRGGTYLVGDTGIRITSKIGTEENPIIVESYPGETAILDGKNRTPQDVIDGLYPTSLGFYLNLSKYIHVRKLEVTGMSQDGLFIKGSHNKVEGCKIHGNFLTGLHTLDRAFYITPYYDGYNIITDNFIYNNSDAGIIDAAHNDGDNADGISISSGRDNVISHNTIYANSDDGIDTWKSNNTLVEYNLVYDSGKGIKGNGNGIKMGGNIHTDITSEDDNGKGTKAFYNISYENRGDGFDQNAGRDVVVKYNTAFNNGGFGYNFTRGDTYGPVSISDNIAKDNSNGFDTAADHESRSNNSWNIGGIVEFISTSVISVDFLKPFVGGLYESIGAYANSNATTFTANPSLSTSVPIWIIGDSTVSNYSEDIALGGFGTYLVDLFINKDRAFNKARSGASARSYKPTKDNDGLFWGDGSTINIYNEKGLKQVMLEADTSNGGYLLIAFGHNDAYIQGVEYSEDVRSVPGIGNEWDTELMEYIAFARSVNVTPILLTSSARMRVYNNREYYRYYTDSLHETTPAPYDNLRGQPADWPQTIRDIAAREKVLLLDLMTKSANHYKTFPTNQDIFDLYSYDAYNSVHTNKVGAKKLADLIKELAVEAGATGFIEQFH